MLKFRATATSVPHGYTFVFFFLSSGWSNIERTAREALEKEEGHDEYGPWNISGIDVSG